MNTVPDSAIVYCSVEGCDNKKFQKGWCQKHYTRQYRYGSLDAVSVPHAADEYTFVATVADLAWSAGFIDGEGAIMIVWSRSSQINRRGRTETKADQFSVHLRVGQSCMEPLLKLKELFGGGVKALDMSLPSRVKNRRPFYEWNIYGKRAVAVLEAVKPYLLVKQDHAQLAIDFQQECFGTTSNFETRKAYFDLMAELQQKGQHLKREV